MHTEEILFDIFCLDKGLPPLSGKPSEIAKMITQLPSRDRRLFTRKIKKECKKRISEKVSLFPVAQGEDVRKDLEIQLGFKSDDQLFINRLLVKRVSFVRSFEIRNFRTQKKEGL